MLRRAHDLKNMVIRATDGDIGLVDDLLFDDGKWTVRYLVVETGGWLTGRKVLLSPASVHRVDWQSDEIEVDLTRAQVSTSPDVSTDQPVSRQQEELLGRHYGWPLYWGSGALWSGPAVWGGVGVRADAGFGGAFPALLAPIPTEEPEDVIAAENDAPPEPEQTGDPHLRSATEVAGYRIEASDGEIGHVEDFLIDDEAWALRYMLVATRNWLPGKKVLLPPRWTREIRWSDHHVQVDLKRETIESAPEYDEGQVLSRDYEDRLHDHYVRPKYWQDPAMSGRPRPQADRPELPADS